MEKRNDILRQLGSWLVICLLNRDTATNRRLNLHVVGNRGDTGKTMIAYVVASIAVFVWHVLKVKHYIVVNNRTKRNRV